MMKLAICLSLLVGLVAVNAQGDPAPACKNGKRTVSECSEGEFSIRIEDANCQVLHERTGKCMADSDGNMVPVQSVFKRLECFYTLPDMSKSCDPVTKTLTQSQTLVSGNVEECEQTIERTVNCSENSDGDLVPNRHEMRRNQRPERPGGEGPNSERPDGPQRGGPRGGRRTGRGPRNAEQGTRRPPPRNGTDDEERVNAEGGQQRPAPGNGGEGEGNGGEGRGNGSQGRGNGGEGRRNGGEGRGNGDEGRRNGGNRRGPPRRPPPPSDGEGNGEE